MSIKVCVVGNGASVLKSNYGAFVDSCDVVLRMGRSITKGYESFVGTKTDILGTFPITLFQPLRGLLGYPIDLYLKAHYPTLEDFRGKFSELGGIFDLGSCSNFYWNSTSMFRTVPDLLGITSKDLTILGDPSIVNFFKNKHILYKESSDLLRLAEKFRCSSYSFAFPSSGMIYLDTILKVFKDSDIYVLGFDFFKSGWYWYPKMIHKTYHPSLDEKIYFLNLKNSGRINVLD